MSQGTLEGWDKGGSPDARRCLSFVLRGPWAHFRRIEGNIVKQTYRIIPRTTVAGLVAAIIGKGRDSYYDSFAPENSQVAIEPIGQLRTMNMPQNTLSTAKEHLRRVPSRGDARISLPDPSKARQQHNYEVLVDPAYRIDMWLADTELTGQLRDRLAAGTSFYPPSLGLSEHLAEVTYLGEHTVGAPVTETTRVDSVLIDAVDDIELETDRTVRIERSPGYMQATEAGRTTTGFLSVAYSPSADGILAHDVTTYDVDGRRVMFS